MSANERDATAPSASPARDRGLVALARDRGLVALVLVALLLVATTQLAAIDLWWQLRAGRWIAEHGLPTVDPFSFGFPGRPWIEQRWLFFTAAHALASRFGLNALIVAKLVVLALCFAGLDRAMRPARAWARAAGLAVAVLLLHSRLRFRPELATYAGVIAMLVAFEAHRARARAAEALGVVEGEARAFGASARALAWLPLVQVVWSNAHTLWIVGPALAWAAWGAEALAARAPRAADRLGLEPALSRRARRELALAAGAVTLAAFVTPYLFMGYVYPTTIVEQIGVGSKLREAIVELRSPFAFRADAVYFGTYVGALAVSLAGWLLPGRAPLFRVVAWAGFVGFSLLSSRNTALLGPVAGWALARQLADAEASGMRGLSALRAASRALALAIAVGLGAAAATDALWRPRGWHQRFGFGVRQEIFPIEAMAFAAEHGLPRPVFSSLSDASYLIHEGGEGSVYLDGRLEVYGVDIVLENTRQLGERGAMLRIVDALGLDTALLEFPLMAQAIRDFEARPDWVPVYYDRAHALYLRRTPATAPLADALALDWNAAARPRAAIPRALDPPDWLDGLAPRMADATDASGRAALLAHVGARDAAARASEEVLALRPDDLPARVFLGALAEARGDDATARAHFARVAERDLARDDVVEVRLQVAASEGARELRVALARDALARGNRSGAVLAAITDGAFDVAHPDEAARFLAEQIRDEEARGAGAASLAPLHAASGLVAQRSGRFRDAAYYYERSLALDAAQPKLWRALVACYERAGLADAARAAAQRARDAGVATDGR
ncbi:MAG: hypothetical protein R3E88_16490 [Myxococcota bacterium]